MIERIFLSIMWKRFLSSCLIIFLLLSSFSFGPSPVYAASIQITSPSNGQTFKIGDTVALSASAAGVDYVKFYVGNDNPGGRLTGSYSTNWSTAGKAPGSYMINVKGYSSSAQVLAENSIKITLVAQDTQPPVVTISSPVNGASYKAGDIVNKAASATDNQGVARMAMYINGIPGKDASGNTLSYSWNTEGKTLGTYSIKVNAIDPKGNVGTKTVTINLKSVPATTKGPVDSTSPTVNGTDPAKDATNVPANKIIVVTFSENILAGTNFSKISVKNSSNNQNAYIKTPVISGNRLSISRSDTWRNSTRYVVTIPAGAVKDSAGNALASSYNFAFTIQNVAPKVPQEVIKPAVPSKQTPPKQEPPKEVLSFRLSAPEDFKIKAVNQTTVELHWSPVPGAQRYNIYRVIQGQIKEKLSSNKTSYTDTGLNPGTLYWYAVTAVSGNSEGPWSESLDVTTPKVEAPKKLKVRATSATTVDLKWEAVPGAERYYVYRVLGQSKVQLTANTNSFTDIGLNPGTTYWYAVAGVSGNAVGPWPDSVNVTTPKSNGQSANLKQPDKLKVRATGTTTVNLQWEAVPGAEKYYVYRIVGGSYVQLTANTNSFTDTGLNPGTKYWFAVAPVAGWAVGPWSKSRDVTTPRLEAPSIREISLSENGLPYLRWTDSSGANGYYVYRKKDSEENWSSKVRVSSWPTSYYDNTKLEPGQVYHYAVAAADTVGEGKWSNSVLIAIPSKAEEEYIRNIYEINGMEIVYTTDEYPTVNKYKKLENNTQFNYTDKIHLGLIVYYTELEKTGPPFKQKKIYRSKSVFARYERDKIKWYTGNEYEQLLRGFTFKDKDLKPNTIKNTGYDEVLQNLIPGDTVTITAKFGYAALKEVSISTTIKVRPVAVENTYYDPTSSLENLEKYLTDNFVIEGRKGIRWSFDSAHQLIELAPSFYGIETSAQLAKLMWSFGKGQYDINRKIDENYIKIDDTWNEVGKTVYQVLSQLKQLGKM